jgi:lipid II:glycine glycyltransferase (peptidoglycan interpeptide bridge formation enzyme)
MQLRLEPEDIEALQENRIIQQTGFWAEVKRKQGARPIAFHFETSEDLLDPSGQDHRLISNDLLVLVRRIDEQHTMAYVPYGPKEEPSTENQGLFLEELSEVLRSHLPSDCIFIRYDLPWESQWSKEEDNFDLCGNWLGPPAPEFQEIRVNFKTRKRNLYKSRSNILPVNTFFLNLRQEEDELLGRMRPKTRYNIRLAGRKRVTVRNCGRRHLDEWYSLYRETALRNGIYVHDPEYFHTVFESSAENGDPGLDVRLLLADHEGELLAAMFLVLSLKRATYLYGASSGNKRQLMATYALQWEAIRVARYAGCMEYDMFGTAPNADPKHPMHGLHRFKSGFGGRIFHRMGCWDYPLDREYYLAYSAQEWRNQAYHLQ